MEWCRNISTILMGLDRKMERRCCLLYAIAGNDSGGGAGLSADARAAEAWGVHVCPVVAAITVQNTQNVRQVVATKPELLAAQLEALAEDMPPAVIKTGVLGSAANVRVVAAFVRQLRLTSKVILVVDPVLRASSGDALAGEERPQTCRHAPGPPRGMRKLGSGPAFSHELAQALAHELLPLADVITPNVHEAAALAEYLPSTHQQDRPQIELETMAQALQAMGASTVCITGGDAQNPLWAQDYFCSPHASGWLRLPRIQTTNTHGTGCSFASSVACALALGFVAADAIVLAKMAVAAALQADADQASPGRGPGPVRVSARAAHGFLPELLTSEQLQRADQPLSPRTRDAVAAHGETPGCSQVFSPPCGRLQPNGRFDERSIKPIGIYAIVNNLEHLQQVLQSPAALGTVRTVQLRIKTDASDVHHDADAMKQLRPTLAKAIGMAREAGAMLYINDHWQLALELGADAVHLGQEDLLALGPPEQEQLRAAQARGLQLGISSHSVWELCRAKAWQPSYIACGPVWPTTTKNMPWHAQGLHNLAWWCAAAAPTPVVAIGGILLPEQAEEAARCGAQGVCLVRGLMHLRPSEELKPSCGPPSADELLQNQDLRKAGPTRSLDDAVPIYGKKITKTLEPFCVSPENIIAFNAAWAQGWTGFQHSGGLAQSDRMEGSLAMPTWPRPSLSA